MQLQTSINNLNICSFSCFNQAIFSGDCIIKYNQSEEHNQLLEGMGIVFLLGNRMPIIITRTDCLQQQNLHNASLVIIDQELWGGRGIVQGWYFFLTCVVLLISENSCGITPLPLLIINHSRFGIRDMNRTYRKEWTPVQQQKETVNQ